MPRDHPFQPNALQELLRTRHVVMAPAPSRAPMVHHGAHGLVVRKIALEDVAGRDGFRATLRKTEAFHQDSVCSLRLLSAGQAELKLLAVRRLSAA